MTIQQVLIGTAVISALCLSSCGGDGKKKPKVNHAPVTTDVTVNTQADTAVTANFIATDEDGDSLTYTILTAPTQGTVVQTTRGGFTYTPNADTTGVDEFTFAASDASVRTSPAKVSITIAPLDVAFDVYSRKAYAQDMSATPLPLNTRNVTQNVNDPKAYDDLLK